MNVKSGWSWTLYLFSLSLALEIVLQGYYRVTTGTFLYHRDKPPIWVADPVSGWTNRPNLSYRHVTPEFAVDLHTNSQGFRVSQRHEEYSVEKPPHTYRILVLGPSFAYGWGVDFEDTFGVQLQAMLVARGWAAGRSIEVLNHGVPGLPPVNEFDWFRNSGVDYSPDLVIHLAYGSLKISAEPNRSIVVTKEGHIHTDTTAKERMWSYAKRSATVFYTGILFGQLARFSGIREQGRTIEGAGRPLQDDTNFDPESMSIIETMGFYQSFERAVRQTGAKFLVVYLPLSYIVHPQDRGRWMMQGVEDINGQVRFNQAFTARLNQEGIQCVNVTDALIDRAMRDAQRLYYWLDVHWTSEGNRLAASVVTTHILNDISIDRDQVELEPIAGMN